MTIAGSDDRYRQGAIAEAVIELQGVAVGYDGPLVLEGVDLVVRRGELVALVGGNGAGKSTLLKVIVGLLRPRNGNARVFGGSPNDGLARIAYLPQAEHLQWDYPLVVEDVVLMGRVARLGLGRRAGRGDRDAVGAALARVDAGHLRRRPIAQLSGGERQRVLLSRALVSDPDLLLLDAPATGVDPTTEEQLMSVLEQLVADGKTVLVATHDLAGVMAHFRRVVCMNGGIVADGDVAILRDDAVLRRTYGGHRPGEALLVADQHHA